MLLQLAEAGEMGDFTVAYFADNDYRSHEVGPVGAFPVVERVDRALGSVFDSAGGADRFMRDTCVIVTSDHGHCEVLSGATAAIRLEEVLQDFRRADLARGWRADDQIMVCPNMRAAQVYFKEIDDRLVRDVTRAALADERIDLVMRKSSRSEGSGTYCVGSRRGTLEFERAGADGGCARDAFATRWRWSGEEDVLRLDIEDGVVDSAEYPNALERIAGILDAPNSGDLWLTARPGCEFEVPGGSPHVGGASHGALHALDSLSPLIVGGAGAPRLPRAIRSVDIAPLCMQILGLPMRYQVGGPRGSPSV
jgi:hypothetical protein